MKKNISINIFGTIYAIDEDAYQLLENYLQSMKSYFQRQEGGEEIADDIEHRVAELLWERKEQGMEAVNIETVKEIIEKIGNATDIDDEANTESRENTTEDTDNATGIAEGENVENRKKPEDQERQNDFFNRLRDRVRHKRLYRNTDDKMIGGVCSGLAEYFEVGDVTVWRLLTVILTVFFASIHFTPRCFSFIIPMLYILLLIITPRAVTPEDKLRMKGREVNPNTLKDQIVSESESLADEKAAAARRSGASLSGCLHIITMLFLAAMLFPLAATLLGLIISTIGLLVSLGCGIGVLSSMFDPSTLSYIQSGSPILLASLISGIVVLALLLWGIISLIRPSGSGFSRGRFFTFLVIWLIALATCISCGLIFGMDIHNQEEKIHMENCTRNGITLEDMTQWQRLDESGWKISQMQNVLPYIIYHDEDLESLPYNYPVIRRLDDAKPISIEMNRTQNLDAGYYSLTALTENAGSGLRITAANAAKPSEIFATICPDIKGTDLKHADWKEAVALAIISDADSSEWNGFIDDNKDIQLHTSAPFHHAGGDITLSIKADKAYLNSCNVRMLCLKPAEAPSTVKDKRRK